MRIFQKLSSLSFGLILWQFSVANAQPFNSYPAYVPRTDTDGSSSQQRRRASSSRGCSGEEKAQLTIISPEDIALTASTHPTFWIYLSEVPSHTVRVSVSHPKESEPIYEKDLKVEKAGFQRIDLPASRQGLRSEETYVLTVGILCNPLRLSESIYARVVFKKVDLTIQTKQQLVLAANDTEKAAIYAIEGIWYDALMFAYQDPNYFRHLISQSKIHVSLAP